MSFTKFRFFWPNGFRGEEFKKSANQKQESPVAAMFVNGSGRNEQSLSILVSDWSISKKSSTLKQLGQMDQNVVGSIYGRSPMGIAHSVLIPKKTWPS
jgi:hypothetical protein